MNNKSIFVITRIVDFVIVIINTGFIFATIIIAIFVVIVFMVTITIVIIIIKFIFSINPDFLKLSVYVTFFT